MAKKHVGEEVLVCDKCEAEVTVLQNYVNFLKKIHCKKCMEKDTFGIRFSPIPISAFPIHIGLLPQGAVTFTMGRLVELIPERMIELLPSSMMDGDLSVDKDPDGRFYVRYRKDGKDTIKVEGYARPGTKCGGLTAADAIGWFLYWTWFGDLFDNIYLKALMDIFSICEKEGTSISLGGRQVQWNEDGSYKVLGEATKAA